MADVTVKNLSKEYWVDDNRLRVLNDISYSFIDGTITVILGKSGCGKTTLIRLIAGLEEPCNGDINIKESSRVGIVFQENRLMPWLTVEENINFSVENKQSTTSEQYIELMGLRGFRGAYPNQLSGGMAQRASIARTLTYEPDIILMDEPFAALDYFTRRNLQNELLKIYELKKKTIIFITHNVEEALLLGHKIILLENGSITNEYDLSGLTFPRDINSNQLLILKQSIIDKICNV